MKYHVNWAQGRLKGRGSDFWRELPLAEDEPSVPVVTSYSLTAGAVPICLSSHDHVAPATADGETPQSFPDSIIQPKYQFPLTSRRKRMGDKRTILVTGATGKQGRALINALARIANGRFRVLALTRNATSSAAQVLLGIEEESDISISPVEGDLDNPETIRKVFEDATSEGGVWGVFAVMAYPGLGANAEGEERQGKVGTLRRPACDLTFTSRNSH
jgi:hypothetical protein